MFSRTLILARAAITLGAVALAGAACDERSGPEDEGPEILEEDLEDRADDRDGDEDVDDDPLSGCRQVSPTVLGVSFDIERPGDLRLFAFSGLCPDCDGAPCPPERTVTLVIPAAGIDYGVYTVSDDVTGDELFSLIVYSG